MFYPTPNPVMLMSKTSPSKEVPCNPEEPSPSPSPSEHLALELSILETETALKRAARESDDEEN